MSFGLHFKYIFEAQIKKDNIYYYKSIKQFVADWDNLLQTITNINAIYKLHFYNDFLLLTSIINKEIFKLVFFNINIDLNILNNAFEVIQII